MKISLGISKRATDGETSSACECMYIISPRFVVTDWFVDVQNFSRVIVT